jgi:hypothetical protein
MKKMWGRRYAALLPIDDPGRILEIVSATKRAGQLYAMKEGYSDGVNIATKDRR